MAVNYFAKKKAQLAPIGTTPTADPTTANVTPAKTTTPVQTAPVSSPSTNAPATKTTIKPAPVAPLSNAVTRTSTPSTGYGGASYGSGAAANSAITANQTALKNDSNYVKSEIDRTLGVIKERESQGLDTADQHKYLSTNLGYKAPVDPAIPDWVTAQETTNFNNQLASLQGLQNTYQNQLASALTQNNQYVAKQIDGAQQFQNRRGGLYSGGLDYQEGAVRTAGLQRQSDLQAQYGDQINSIAQQIQNLQTSQPDIVRQKVQDYLNNQFNQNVTEAGLTGMYNGQQTLAGQNQSFNQGLSSKQANWNAYMDVVGQTGNLGAGPSTDWSRNIANANSGEQTIQGQQITSGLVSEQQSRDLASRNYALQEWAQNGYATPTVSDILGVPVNTPTSDQAYRTAAQTLDNDKFTYQQMQDVASTRKQQATAQTITPAEAGALISNSLSGIQAQISEAQKYGEVTPELQQQLNTAKEDAFESLYNNYGLSGTNMVSALSKAGYTLAEINTLKSAFPQVFQ